LPVSYNSSLVLTSLAVAILASYVAMNLVSNVSAARGRTASMLWLGGSALAMGTGIWSMHFVGMLAASIGIQMTYHLGWTALSLLIAVLISGFALYMVSGVRVGGGKLLLCGVVMGIGIASMHYVGMGALQISPSVRYDPLLFALSVVIAIVASYVALWLFVTLRPTDVSNRLLKRGGSAVVMGIAIVGMHYTGMAAAGFSPDSICTVPSPDTDNSWLALTIAGFTVMMLGTALLGSMFDMHMTRRSEEHQSHLLQVNELLRKEKLELAQANEQLRSEIAERTAAEQASREADASNNAKSTFLATMSHEIRTPMNGLLGMLEMLSLTHLDRSQHASLKVIRESGKSLMRIIDDILDFSKIEAGRMDMYPEPVRLKELIEDVRESFTANASSKGLPLSCRVDPRISEAVSVDPLRLRQILNNLVSNAIKFTHAGEVYITVDLLDRAQGVDRVRFAVKDTGIGISEESQRQLFTPYTQAEMNTTRSYGGTGLGLAICQRLAALMGGEITMQSAVGKGTTMVLELSLPIADAKLLAPPEPKFAPVPLRSLPERRAAVPPSVPQAEAQRTLVLVADDHPINRMLLMSQINVLGYAAESAANGAEALMMWKSGRFSLVLTDCNMPEMNGYDLARAIRRLEAASGAPRCPVLACTANAMSDEAANCLEAGMDDYLVKPMDLKSLHTKLKRWLPMSGNLQPGLI
jgi:signal transduction histidine kinase/ActR/RegA family two-component response regulator